VLLAGSAAPSLALLYFTFPRDTFGDGS